MLTVHIYTPSPSACDITPRPLALSLSGRPGGAAHAAAPAASRAHHPDTTTLRSRYVVPSQLLCSGPQSSTCGSAMSPSVQSPAPGSAFHPGDATAACGRRGRAARQRQATAAGRARPPQRAVGQVCLGAAQSRECALRHAGGEGGVDGTVMAPVMLLSSPSSSSICQRLARANSDMPDRPGSDRDLCSWDHCHERSLPTKSPIHHSKG